MYQMSNLFLRKLFLFHAHRILFRLISTYYRRINKLINDTVQSDRIYNFL